MSTVRMVKCTLVARRDDADEVLEALQDAGIVHVIPIAVPAEMQGEVVSGRQARPRDDTDVIRAQLERRRHALANVAAASSRLQVTDKSVPEVLAAVDALLVQQERASAERAHVEANVASLEPWGDFDPDDIETLRRRGVRVTFSIFTRDEWHAVESKRIAYAVAREEEARLFVVLFDVNPNVVKAPEVEIPKARLSSLKARDEELARELARINRELGRFAHYAPVLERMMDALADRAALLAAIDGGVVAGPLFALEGYVPAENVVELEGALEPFHVAQRFEDPRDDDKPPVKLRNNALVSGFEAVVRSFSGVSYKEKDFTWAVGILFLVFGSLCLLDGGYGLLLLLTGLVLKARGNDAFGKVFALTGAVSIVIGALAGQFFGLVIGQHIYKDLLPPLTLSSDPYSCFLFSLVVGMVALLFSFSMAIWQRGWRTPATGSLFLVFAAMALVFANLANEYVLTLAYQWNKPPAEVLASARQVGNLVGAGFGVVTFVSWLAFPDPVFGPTARVGNIVWTLYSGTTGFVQDVLSHMRLFGIALSGSIMALVVNEIGSQFPGPLTIAFAVVGHGFVYLLSLLSLYIHTNRLIFLEFGSKCIDGGQHEYAPLRRRQLA